MRLKSKSIFFLFLFQVGSVIKKPHLYVKKLEAGLMAGRKYKKCFGRGDKNLDGEVGFAALKVKS